MQSLSLSSLSAAARLARAPASTAPTVGLALLGPGRVGRALLAQLQQRALPDLHLRAIADRRHMWLSSEANDSALGKPKDKLKNKLNRPGLPVKLDDLVEHLLRSDDHAHILIDCSASPQLPDYYPDWLARGLHIVTPNKHGGSGPLSRWQAIRAASKNGGHFRHEATVGAGLPVVQTLRDMMATGDELLQVECMLSGTLAWLCNRHDGRQPFSALVRQAHELGYTEPDPRADLSGLDVARKLVILAREAGGSLSLDQVEVESLVPETLAAGSSDEFMQQLEALDGPMDALLQQARSQGGVLRHVGQLNASGQARVALVVLPQDHPFAHTRLTDNVVQFQTRRYAENPLVVQGPGAGPQVTAAGVFADALRIAESAGVRS